jgi:hypothetical protein
MEFEPNGEPQQDHTPGLQNKTYVVLVALTTQRADPMLLIDSPEPDVTRLIWRMALSILVWYDRSNGGAKMKIVVELWHSIPA